MVKLQSTVLKDINDSYFHVDINHSFSHFLEEE